MQLLTWTQYRQKKNITGYSHIHYAREFGFQLFDTISRIEDKTTLESVQEKIKDQSFETVVYQTRKSVLRGYYIVIYFK